MAQEQNSYFAKRLLEYKTFTEGVNRGCPRVRGLKVARLRIPKENAGI